MNTSARFTNPFRPGAGHMPPYLAGRDAEKKEFSHLALNYLEYNSWDFFYLIFEVMIVKFLFVGMTNRQRPLLRFSHSSPMMRFSSASV